MTHDSHSFMYTHRYSDRFTMTHSTSIPFPVGYTPKRLHYL